MTQALFLVGARGCGKTTVGRLLARQLGYQFMDTDHYLLNQSGKNVADIVATEGWSGFRQRESQALSAVTAPSTVIATGGGMILADENRQFMAERGVVIWLDVPVKLLAERLDASPETEQRPSLTGKKMADEIRDVLAERETLYRHAAHITIAASDAPETIVMSILQQLPNFSAIS